MVTLRLVLDRLLDPRPGGSRRYASNLAREIIARAPAGCDVQAILPKVPAEELERFETEVPGLTGVTQGPLKHETLATSWRRGLLTGSVGGGFIHAMGLFAPVRDISLAYGIDQTVVTVGHTTAFRRPELLPPAEVKFQTAMLRRVHKYASAVVAPTNAVADELMDVYDFGDRLRVIGGAADPAIRLPDDEAEGDRLARAMGLPDEYVITSASVDPRKGLEHLLRAMTLPEMRDLRLVVVGRSERGDVTLEQLLVHAGLGPDRVVAVGQISDQQLAVALQRASALVVPSLEAGFGLPIVEAFRFGTPVIHSDVPALMEVGMDATIVVERGDLAGYPERIAHAVTSVVTDTGVERALRIAGRDRSGVYHWEFSADQVWTLHADL